MTKWLRLLLDILLPPRCLLCGKEIHSDNSLCSDCFTKIDFISRPYCKKCGREYGLDAVKNSEGVPKCECGGIIKPDVVLYGENLNDDVMNRAAKAINEAQVLIVGGTSLSVWPAASLIDYFRGEALVVINKSSTPRDRNADLLIKEPIGQVFSQIKVNQK
mgnify:CR=1 FL=1